MTTTRPGRLRFPANQETVNDPMRHRLFALVLLSMPGVVLAQAPLEEKPEAPAAPPPAARPGAPAPKGDASAGAPAPPAEAAPKGPAPSAGPREFIVGSILRVEDDHVGVTLDQGRAAGVEPGMQFDVFSQPEKVIVPGTAKEAFRFSRVIAHIQVNEVEADRSRGILFQKFAADRTFIPGLHIRQSEVPLRRNTPPNIKAARLKPDRPRWGDVVEITLDVVDIERDVFEYRWEVDGGIFLDVPPTGPGRATTTVPRLRWLCPREAKTFGVTVEARDPDNTDRKKFALQAYGLPEAAVVSRLVPEGVFAGMSRHFVQADDLAFDPDGRAFVLDNNIHKVACLRPDFSLAWATNEYNEEWRPLRIAVTRESLFLLDARDRDIKEFRARREMFDGPPERVYGAPGGRGFRLRKPVAMALGPQGEIYVADAELQTVQRFDRQGAAQVQIGAKGEEKGQFQDLIDVAATSPDLLWALDRARRKVVVYAGLKLVDELDAVGSGDEPAALGTVGNEVRVLGRRGIWALDRGQAPREVMQAPPGQFWSLQGARDVTGDVFGFLYVVGAGGRSILRFNKAGRFRGQWGGMDFSQAERVAANENGEMALLSPPQGLVWKLDRQGWVMDWLSTGSLQVRDVALAGNGGLWLLDAGTNRLVQAATGPRVGAREIPLTRQRVSGSALAAAQEDRLYVLERADTLRVHAFTTEGVKAGSVALAGSRPDDGAHLAVDPAGRFYVWGAGGACKAFGADGKALPGAAFPAGEVAGVCAGADGTVFALAAQEPTIWLVRGRTERAVPFRGEGVFARPLGFAGDGYRRLYVLDGDNGRVVRLAPP